jgi:hypothetical protein
LTTDDAPTYTPQRRGEAKSVRGHSFSRRSRKSNFLFFERLKQIVAEYAEARSRLSELEAELGFLLSRATSLAAA